MTAMPPRQETAIDWNALRTQLERLEAAAHATLETTPEQAQAVLEARARALACVPAAAAGDETVLTVVTFTLASEPYAVETRFVRRVVRSSDVSLTPVPGTPAVLLGVVNMGGEILAVFDLGRLFGLPPGARTDQARLLVLGTDRDEFGVLADAASEVRRLPIDAILDPPGSFEGLGRSLLRGVTEDALIVLDGAALIRDPRLFVDHGEEVAQHA